MLWWMLVCDFERDWGWLGCAQRVPMACGAVGDVRGSGGGACRGSGNGTSSAESGHSASMAAPGTESGEWCEGECGGSSSGSETVSGSNSGGEGWLENGGCRRCVIRGGLGLELCVVGFWVWG